MLQKLPVDLSTFSILRTQNYLYVDKTKYAYDLISGGRRFFLARPRRFGKTLFVSTLKEILQGNKELFHGLWIAQSDYHWQPYGLITLDLSAWGINNADTLTSSLKKALIQVMSEYKLETIINHEAPEHLLHDLVRALKSKFGRVAILIDEYDNPILHTLRNQERAQEIRDGIGRFFAAIKGLDAEIDFVFITGVSSFSKAGLFSGMNNLQSITLQKKYAAICGYSDTEVDEYFKHYIETWTSTNNTSYTALRQQIKEWYNGYKFGDTSTTVYNPFSLLNSLNTQKFTNFWIQTGTPTFLIHQIQKEPLFFDPDKLEISEDSLGALDVGKMPTPVLMFQAGYLTIDHYDQENQLYVLTYPNYEVKTATQKYLLEAVSHLDAPTTERITFQLKTALAQADIATMVMLIDRLCSKVPYQILGSTEAYYHSLLLWAFTLSGIETHAEYSIADGRIDVILKVPGKIYVIEVKFNKTGKEALDQIKQKNYFKPFLDTNNAIIAIGLSLNRAPGNFSIDSTYEKIS